MRDALRSAALITAIALAGCGSGALKIGRHYTLVGRLQRTGDKNKQASALWLFSYDAL